MRLLYLACWSGLLFAQRSLLAMGIGSKEIERLKNPLESLWKRSVNRNPEFHTRTNHNRHRGKRHHRDERILYIIKKKPLGRKRRSISDAVIETARCEHIELVDCEAYDSDEMTCMITATGMPCCICNGKLKSLKARRQNWSLW
ncbi:unnamed protein product [Bursaphelenchus xylophilus]|uniref:(pine wood nematode) hypothetical protein n=1 Tax=Bursaphelenchus xylophilus TaxID=6326 RepID=A0A1I7SFG0_BURXY|nr:unnamed protein product [Bursaphelenchus xylophilus]CAG9113466.1 unnamed protein product [Bursaphelenchus xylophilus]